ncbi:hypothetical protein [Paenibacillus methanolicus]|uniref:Uncharacterized protein n=1 Tax=Paenibacillus methanolicus TaxID=582686 RepID=A0A5S5BZV1_9BACL|nr:hypothetical protein [Paenibacillus methanolicus]TYP72469.1 hypothetical protein BCM02_108123 [Paenibacillus methanolicus]
MSQDTPEYTLAETLGGRWRKLGPGVRAGTLLVEMGDAALVSLHISSQRLDIMLKDEQDVFQYAGDLTFEDLDREGKMHFHSWSIEHIHMNNQHVRIDNPLNDLTSLFIKISLAKRREAERRFLKQDE